MNRAAVKRLLAPRAGSHAVTVLLAFALGVMLVVAFVAIRVTLSIMH
jgi:hypothetical protein